MSVHHLPFYQLVGRRIGGAFSKNKRVLAVGALVLVALVVGAALYINNVPALVGLTPTKSGHFLERFVPGDVELAVTFNPSDAAERGRFSALSKRIFKEQSEAVLPFIVGSFSEKYRLPIDLSDTKAIFGETSSILYATRGSEFYLLVATDDLAASQRVLDRMLAQNNALFGEMNDEIVIITNSEQAAQNTHTGRGYSRKSLLANKKFRSAYSEVKTPLSGYAYTAMKVPLQTSLITLHSTPKGIHFSSNGFFGEKITSALVGSNGSTLYEKIPATNALVFSYATEAAQSIELLIPALAKTFAVTEEDLGLKFFSATGLDLREDVLPLLIKGVAVTFQDLGTGLPAISLYADVSTAAEKAEKIVRSLDQVAAVWTALINNALKAAPDLPIAEQKTFKQIPKGSTLSLNFKRVPKSVAGVSLFDVIGDKLEFSYGITADKIFFISTIPSIESVLPLKAPITQTELYKEVKALNPAPKNFSIIDGSALNKYLDTLVGLLREFKKLSAAEEASYEKIKSYITPLKGLVQISEFVSESQVKGEGLLLMNEK